MWRADGVNPTSILRSFIIAQLTCLLCSAGASALGSQAPSPPILSRSDLTRLESELAVVQHIRYHLLNPQDGVALAADRRDLARLHATAPRSASPSVPSIYTAAPMPGTLTTDSATLAIDLGVLADLWHARVNDRTPFRMLDRDRLQALDRAQHALSRVGTSMGMNETNGFVPAMQEELSMLARDIQGMGNLSDAAIDASLLLSEAGAMGRPFPPGSRFGGPPPPRPPAGSLPPPGSQGYPPLPPGYGPGSGLPPSPDVSPCHAERMRAGESANVAGMLIVADCWARERTSPLWGSYVIEALDWAARYASIARRCADLEMVAARAGSFGTIPSPYPEDRQRLSELIGTSQARFGRFRMNGSCR